MCCAVAVLWLCCEQPAKAKATGKSKGEGKGKARKKRTGPKRGTLLRLRPALRVCWDRYANGAPRCAVPCCAVSCHAVPCVIPTAPRAALSAWVCFVRAYRPTIVAENPSAGFGEVTRLLAARWKSLEADDKLTYTEAAAQDKQRYETELKAWNAERAARRARGELSSDEESRAKDKEELRAAAAHGKAFAAGEEQEEEEAEEEAGEPKRKKRKAEPNTKKKKGKAKAKAGSEDDAESEADGSICRRPFPPSVRCSLSPCSS